MPRPLRTTRCLKVASGSAGPAVRIIAEETAVALVYDGATHAVMMATPADLEDFAVGFSLGENVIASKDEIVEIAIEEQADGIELRMWLERGAGQRIALRRRAMLGPTGCGLCGVESLAAARPILPRVEADRVFTRRDVVAAMGSSFPAQTLNRAARAMHAAGLFVPGRGLVMLREDVGRHNALDKLAGAVARAGADPSQGIVVLTSRVSVEMVQKAAAMGAPVIAAMSAPTALAVRAAHAAGLTLIAVARQESFEIFTHPGRMKVDAGQRVRAKGVRHQSSEVT